MKGLLGEATDPILGNEEEDDSCACLTRIVDVDVANRCHASLEKNGGRSLQNIDVPMLKEAWRVCLGKWMCSGIQIVIFSDIQRHRQRHWTSYLAVNGECILQRSTDRALILRSK